MNTIHEIINSFPSFEMLKKSMETMESLHARIPVKGVNLQKWE